MVTGFEFAERAKRAREEGRPEEAASCYAAAVVMFEQQRNEMRAEEARRFLAEVKADLQKLLGSTRRD